MSNNWPPVKLGSFLRRSEEVIVPSPGLDYREITVRLWGNGVVERGHIMGNALSGRRFLARTGQLVLSKIDARHGALGLVPAALDGALVTNDFPLFNIDSTRLNPDFLNYMCKSAAFVDLCKKASEGSTNRVRLKEDRFLSLEICLPPMHDQLQIATKINRVSEVVTHTRKSRSEQEKDIKEMLSETFWGIASKAPRRPLRELAPLVRRPVVVEPTGSYLELGVRSFGNGTFHKPALTGIEIGTKRIFRIEPGDLIFSNVFAWEGAIAVAKAEDAGRVGSHRFITCVPDIAQTTAEFLCYFFLTNEGLELIGKASPGGAGRNRTLGIAALGRLPVPVPSLEDQHWFGELLGEIATFRRLRVEAEKEIAALLPSVLHGEFAAILRA